MNGEPLLTIAYGSTTLKALVYSGDAATPGTRTVVVLNDGGAVAAFSNKVTLTVTGTGTQRPPPTPPPHHPPQGVVAISVTSPIQNQQMLQTPLCSENASGAVTSWRGCMRSVNGQTHQAIDFNLNEVATLPFNATLYFGSNCAPSRITGQTNSASGKSFLSVGSPIFSGSEIFPIS